MKDYLDKEYWKWHSGDRKRNLRLFAEYLGVEYGALSSWMTGARKPKRDSVEQISKILGPEAFDAAGFARPSSAQRDNPDNNDINFTTLYKMMQQLTEQERELAAIQIKTILRLRHPDKKSEHKAESPDSETASTAPAE